MVNHAKAWEWLRTWLLTKNPHQNQLGWWGSRGNGGLSNMQTPRLQPQAPETGDLKGIWPFANYLYDPWVLQTYSLHLDAFV